MATVRFEPRSIIFFHLLLLLSVHGGVGAQDLYPGEDANLSNLKSETDDVLRLPTERGHEGMMHHHRRRHHHHHLAQEDPSTVVFFTLKDLKQGKAIPVHFPKRDPSSSPKFLPREEAESIPFSSADVPVLLNLFSFPSGSSQATAMEDTLWQCEAAPIVGETKLCATSLESMLDFIRSILDAAPARPTKFTALSTHHLAGSSQGPTFQNYTVSGQPREVAAPRMVACHTMPYPYAVFYCHSQESPSRVFKVPLLGENGDGVEAMAVCHLDTSRWSPDHVSFRVLGIEPGSSHVCHFFPADHFVWIPAN